MTNEQIQALKAAAELSADNFKPAMVADTKIILSLLAERGADKALIAELQSIRAAAKKLVRCKGRYHSEQNYRALTDGWY